MKFRLSVTATSLSSLQVWCSYTARREWNLPKVNALSADKNRPLYELANYSILSRCLYYVPYHSPIHPGRVFTTFTGISTIIEGLNANGAAIVANTKKTPKQLDTGKALLKTALVLQLVVLILFAALAAKFHHNCKKAGLLPKNLKAVLTTLYISSLLIGIRTLYRVIEYFTTSGLHFSDPKLKLSDISPILRYEWFFYVFEAVLMAVNSVLLNARHPMQFLPRNNKIYLAEDGVTEIHGEGYEDTRHWLMTYIDCFDLNGLRKGKNMRQNFWETHAEGRVADPDHNIEMIQVTDNVKGDQTTV